MAKKNPKLATGKIKHSTQQYLDIAEIKDDLVVMKDGTLRAVLLVSSINFALKSEDEQNAIISSYVGFLNNLNFPMQILVQSRELSIEKYLKALKKKEKTQTNELLKMQTAEYIQYVQELVSIGQIMSKKFYAVIPYNPISDKQKSFFSALRDALTPSNVIKLKQKTFDRYKRNMENRIENTMAGFSSMGLSSTQLDTQSLIELYYNTYNPETSKNQKLTDINSLRVSDE